MVSEKAFAPKWPRAPSAVQSVPAAGGGFGHARTRHEGVMKHRKTLEMLNSEYRIGSNVAPENLKKPRNINTF